MKAKKVAFYCLVGLIAGCVPVVSLHPLFTKEDLAFDEKLLGTWVGDANNTGTAWEFARFDESSASSLPKELQGEFKRFYRLNMEDRDDHKGAVAACLVKLGDRMFMDIFPDRFPSGESDIEKVALLYNAFFYVPTHTFVRVDSIGEALKMRLTDDDEFNKFVDAEPKAIAYTQTQDRPILTASTKELQAFVVKYADDRRVFPTDLTLSRKSK